LHTEKTVEKSSPRIYDNLTNATKTRPRHNLPHPEGNPAPFSAIKEKRGRASLAVALLSAASWGAAGKGEPLGIADFRQFTLFYLPTYC